MLYTKNKDLTSITIPNGIITISSSLFESCTRLNTVIIPNGVTTIGNFAFSRCTSLKKVVIPDSVTTINFGAFAECREILIFLGHTTMPSSLMQTQWYPESCSLFYYSETEPITKDNYWHYDESNNIVIWPIIE